MGPNAANFAQVQPAPVQPVTNKKNDNQNDFDYNLNNNIRQPVNVNSIPSDSWFGNIEIVHHGNRRWRSVALFINDVQVLIKLFVWSSYYLLSSFLSFLSFPFFINMSMMIFQLMITEIYFELSVIVGVLWTKYLLINPEEKSKTMKYLVCLFVIVACVEFSSCQRGSYSGMGSISANPAQPAQAQPAQARPVQVQPVTNNRIDSQNEVDSNFNNNNRQLFDVNSFPSTNWFGNVETVHHGNRRWRSVA